MDALKHADEKYDLHRGTVNQSVFIKMIHLLRVMGNENHSKCSWTQQLFIPVLIKQHICT
jgi:hypothetical protein